MFVAKIFNSIPSPESNSFDLGPVTVHFYAVLILIGIVLATFLTAKRLGVRGVKQGLVIDIVIWAVPFGIIGGRISEVPSCDELVSRIVAEARGRIAALTAG